tara:strand:+ start:2750 stop:4255 length:1506 start_codon:yes stop_codon:yes gene_type:complete
MSTNKAAPSNTSTSDKFIEAEFLRENIDASQSVGLSHGVFDILHVGHIEHLKKAKELCDVLVVSLTNDGYVNKGPDRPFFNIEHRLNVVASLEFVDFVTVSNDPSSEYVISCLRPDYYIKGIEYKEKEDITNKIDLERVCVEEGGGEVLFIANENVFSSSSLLNESLLGEKFLEFAKQIKQKYTAEEILHYIDKLGSQTVNLVGEVIIDEYVYGNCLGKSSKYPSIVFERAEHKAFLGGVGAVANQLAALVREVNLLTYIGNNSFSESLDFITSSLSNNVKLDYIRKENSPTIKKTRFIDSYWESRLFEIYDINDAPLSEKEREIFLYKLGSYVSPIAIDYGHGLLNGTEHFFSVNVQSNSGNKGYNFISKYSQPSVSIVDDAELRLEMRDKHTGPTDLSIKLREKIGSEVLVVTRGSHGCIVVDKENVLEIPALSGNVKDTVGAGDAFFGIFSALVMQNTPLEIAALLGNIAGYMEASVIGHKHEYSKLDFKQTVTALLK